MDSKDTARFIYIVLCFSFSSAEWIKQHSTGTCYYVSKDRLRIIPARDKCLEIGSYLIEVNDVREHEFITGFLTANNYWVGMDNHSNEWLWSNSRTQPLRSIVSSLAIRDTGVRYESTSSGYFLDSRSVESSFNYICEKPGGHRVDVNCSLGSLADPDNPNSNLLQLQGKMVIQSSTNKSAANAIDGDMTTCSLTLMTSGYSWWQVDLIHYFIIGRIEIAVTHGHESTLHGLSVQTYISDPGKATEVPMSSSVQPIYDTGGTQLTIDLTSAPLYGRYLRISETTRNAVIFLCEVKAYGSKCEQTMTSLICEDIPYNGVNFIISNNMNSAGTSCSVIVEPSTSLSMANYVSSAQISSLEPSTSFDFGSHISSVSSSSSENAAPLDSPGFSASNTNMNAHLSVYTRTVTVYSTVNNFVTQAVSCPPNDVNTYTYTETVNHLINRTVTNSYPVTILQTAVCGSQYPSNGDVGTTDIVNIHEIKVHKKNTSSYKRTLVSADDSRSSAKILGLCGSSVLAIVITIIVCMDLSRTVKFFRTAMRRTKY